MKIISTPHLLRGGLVLFILFLLPYQHSFAQTSNATMLFQPGTISVEQGNSFMVSIEAGSLSQNVNGAGVYLNFDPTVLQVHSVTPGTRLTTIIQNSVDNTAGTLNFASGLLATTTSGAFTVVTVEFNTLQSGNTTVTFNTTQPRITGMTSDGFYIPLDTNQLDVSISSSQTPKPGDTDGDNDVDIFDYNTVLSFFGQTASGPAQGDLDNDSDVDIFDYNMVIGNFGR